MKRILHKIVLHLKKRLWLVLTIEECRELGLTHSHNLYGDLINLFNSRSAWVDKNGRFYRCDSLLE